MKLKQIITALSLLTAVTGYSQEGNYRLLGRFASQHENGKVFFSYYRNGETKHDSTEVVKGKFTLSGVVDGPQQGYLTFKPAKDANSRKQKTQNLSLYVDRGETIMTIKDSLQNAKFSGTTINAMYNTYENAMVSTKKLEDIRTTYYKLKQNKEDNEDALKALEQQRITLQEKQKEELRDFIQQHKDSYFSLNAIELLGGPYFDNPEVGPLFESLAPALKSSTAGERLEKMIEAIAATIVGKYAPDFEHPDVDGKLVKLSDLKGKYVLLDFWASWCGPCRAENPHVLKTYNTLKDKNFTVLGVSLDRKSDRNKWLKAINDDGLVWTQLNDAGDTNLKGAAILYGVRAIPTNFLIDPSGKIIGKNLRGEDLAEKIVSLMK